MAKRGIDSDDGSDADLLETENVLRFLPDSR